MKTSATVSTNENAAATATATTKPTPKRSRELAALQWKRKKSWKCAGYVHETNEVVIEYEPTTTKKGLSSLLSMFDLTKYPSLSNSSLTSTSYASLEARENALASSLESLRSFFHSQILDANEAVINEIALFLSALRFPNAETLVQEIERNANRLSTSVSLLATYQLPRSSEFNEEHESLSSRMLPVALLHAGMSEEDHPLLLERFAQRISNNCYPIFLPALPTVSQTIYAIIDLYLSTYSPKAQTFAQRKKRERKIKREGLLSLLNWWLKLARADNDNNEQDPENDLDPIDDDDADTHEHEDTPYLAEFTDDSQLQFAEDMIEAGEDDRSSIETRTNGHSDGEGENVDKDNMSKMNADDTIVSEDHSNESKDNYSAPHHQTDSSTPSLPPLVIILPNFSSYSTSVLASLFHLLLNHPILSQLPFVVLIGITSDSKAIHSTFMPSLTNRFDLHSFHLPSTSILLPSLVQSLVFQPILPCWINHEVVKFMSSHYVDEFTSLSSWLRLFEFILITYFDQTPYSEFAFAIWNNQFDFQIKDEDVAILSSLPSIESATVTLSSASFCEIFVKSLRRLHAARQVFPFLISTIHAMAVRLLSRPDIENPLQFYSVFFLEKADDSKASSNSNTGDTISNQLITALHHLPIPDCIHLCNFLQDCLATTVESVSEEVHNQLSDIKTLQSQLTEAIDKLSSPQPTNVSTEIPNVTSVPDAPVQRGRGGRASQRRSAMLSMAHQSQASSQSLRGPVVDFFTNLKSFIVSLQNLPLHELVVFNDASTVSSHFAFDFSSLLTASLNRSSHHFSSEFSPSIIRNIDSRLTQPPESTNSSHNDIAIVHSLLSEHGKYVNIYDWFQSFVAIVAPPDSKIVLTSLPTAELHAYYARFHLAMNAMQIMGFIAETHRKADHVQRTTFYSAD